MEKNESAPTGCFKCGRPGHWSRDCPLSATNPRSNTNQKFAPSSNKDVAQNLAEKSAEKPKRLPRTRPKLTPEILLSDDGVGYILRHFPRSFKYHGRGHEVSDLGNLIELYAQWHLHLLPYYSFDQFVQKVEQVGATRRVRMCIRELRDRVAKGGDPMKLHEPPIEHVSKDQPGGEKGDMNTNDSGSIDRQEDHTNVDDTQDQVIDEIFRDAIQDLPSATEHLELDTEGYLTNSVTNQSTVAASTLKITEEQRIRIEANRLKALERAAATSARSLP